MRKRAALKLKSKRGESIGEVLVALLISALALVLLAGMITYATNFVRRSGEQIEDYLSNGTPLAVQGGSPLEGYVTVKNGSGVSITFHDELSSIQVLFYKNDGIGGHEVIAYRVK